MEQANTTESKRDKKRVILIGWDAADWQHINPLLDQGLMPNLEKLINEGVMGNLATMQPILSPMLWNTIATGKLPDQHGICGFMEPDPVNRGARPVTSISRKCKAIWNILSQSGYRCNVVSWWASHPAEPINGNVVTQNIKFATLEGEDVKLPKGTVHPPELMDELARFVLLKREIKPEDILPFIPDAANIDQKTDKNLPSFIKVLAECASVQASATRVMADNDWDFTAIYFDAIDHFCHAFMPYYPPKMPQISETAFEMFQHVIPGVYRFHDMMLGVQLQMAGDDALVVICSDHGFESGDNRPMVISNEPAGPADWHRDMGMVVLKGPGIKKDERIYGANLIDVTPTILTYLGLPVGADMYGRPMLGAFEEIPEVQVIPSWETVEGDAGMHPPGTELDEMQSDELRKQFIALGYVEDHGDDLEKSFIAAQVELDYNLAQVYLATGRAELAQPLLEKLLKDFPWEVRFVFKLVHCYFVSGYYRQVLRLLEKAFPNENKIPVYMRSFKGRSLMELGDEEAAMEEIQRVMKQNSQIGELQVQLGRIYLGRGDIESAREAFEKSLEINPELAIGHQGLAQVLLKLRDNENAAESALNALGILHHLPRSHYILGVALARMGEYEKAATALEIAASLHGNLPNAHKWLSKLYSRFLNQPDKVPEHELALAKMQSRERDEKQSSNGRAERIFDLPNIPTAEERSKIIRKERPWAFKKEAPTGRVLNIVSGLPRSGTSLMMQILQAGGLPPVTDGERVADHDNPEGYYEWEAVKRLAKEPELLDDPEMELKAIKIISALLPNLPEKHNYRVIFMMRPVEEVVASQRKMIERLDTVGSSQPEEEVIEQLTKHRNSVIQWAQNATNIKIMPVSFAQLIKDPDPILKQLTEFMGAETLPQQEAMKDVIRPDLHRQKAEK